MKKPLMRLLATPSSVMWTLPSRTQRHNKKNTLGLSSSRTTETLKQPSLGVTFAEQLGDLVDMLERTTCHASATHLEPPAPVYLLPFKV